MTKHAPQQRPPAPPPGTAAAAGTRHAIDASAFVPSADDAANHLQLLDEMASGTIALGSRSFYPLAGRAGHDADASRAPKLYYGVEGKSEVRKRTQEQLQMLSASQGGAGARRPTSAKGASRAPIDAVLGGSPPRARSSSASALHASRGATSTTVLAGAPRPTRNSSSCCCAAPPRSLQASTRPE